MLCSRRGIASIIGGVFIILIILSVYAFYSVNNVATNDLQETRRYMGQLDEERSSEKISLGGVTTYGNTGFFLLVTNLSSKIVIIEYVCTLKTSDLASQYNVYGVAEDEGYRYLDPGITTPVLIAGVDTKGSYKIDLITNKGSIFTTFFYNVR